MDPDQRKKIYDTVSEQGLYTKSFTDFEQQYSTPENVSKLYNVLKDKELYTKDLSDFVNQYYSDVYNFNKETGGITQKKNQVGSDGSQASSTLTTANAPSADINSKPSPQIVDFKDPVGTLEDMGFAVDKPIQTVRDGLILNKDIEYGNLEEMKSKYPGEELVRVVQIDGSSVYRLKGEPERLAKEKALNTLFSVDDALLATDPALAINQYLLNTGKPETLSRLNDMRENKYTDYRESKAQAELLTQMQRDILGGIEAYRKQLGNSSVDSFLQVRDAVNEYATKISGLQQQLSQSTDEQAAMGLQQRIDELQSSPEFQQNLASYERYIAQQPYNEYNQLLNKYWQVEEGKRVSEQQRPEYYQEERNKQAIQSVSDLLSKTVAPGYSNLNQPILQQGLSATRGVANLVPNVFSLFARNDKYTWADAWTENINRALDPNKFVTSTTPSNRQRGLSERKAKVDDFTVFLDKNNSIKSVRDADGFIVNNQSIIDDVTTKFKKNPEDYPISRDVSAYVAIDIINAGAAQIATTLVPVGVVSKFGSGASKTAAIATQTAQFTNDFYQEAINSLGSENKGLAERYAFFSALAQSSLNTLIQPLESMAVGFVEKVPFKAVFRKNATKLADDLAAGMDVNKAYNLNAKQLVKDWTGAIVKTGGFEGVEGMAEELSDQLIREFSNKYADPTQQLSTDWDVENFANAFAEEALGSLFFSGVNRREPGRFHMESMLKVYESPSRTESMAKLDKDAGVHYKQVFDTADAYFAGKKLSPESKMAALTEIHKSLLFNNKTTTVDNEAAKEAQKLSAQTIQSIVEGDKAPKNLIAPLPELPTKQTKSVDIFSIEQERYKNLINPTAGAVFPTPGGSEIEITSFTPNEESPLTGEVSYRIDGGNERIMPLSEYQDMVNTYYNEQSMGLDKAPSESELEYAQHLARTTFIQQNPKSDEIQTTQEEEQTQKAENEIQEESLLIEPSIKPIVKENTQAEDTSAQGEKNTQAGEQETEPTTESREAPVVTSKSYSSENISAVSEDFKDVQTPIAKEIINQLPNVSKSLGGIEIVVHRDNESISKALGVDEEDTIINGGFDGNKIHINLASAESAVAFHEAIHPILDAELENNPELIDDFAIQLDALSKNDEDVQEVLYFADQYDDAEQAKKEAVVEFMARVASGRIKLNKTLTQKVKDFFSSILSKLGLGDIIPINSNTDLVSFAQTVAKALQTGTEIRGIKGSKTQFSLTRITPGLLETKRDVAKYHQAIVDGRIDRKLFVKGQVKAYGVTPEQVNTILDGRIALFNKKKARAAEAIKSTIKRFGLSDSLSSFERFHSKYLSSRRGGEPWMREIEERMNGAITYQYQTAMASMKHLRTLIGKNTELENKVNEYIRGDKNIELTKEIRDVADMMRTSIDTLSKTLIDEGYLAGGEIIDLKQAKDYLQGNKTLDELDLIPKDAKEILKKYKESGRTDIPEILQGKDDASSLEFTVGGNIGSYMARRYRIYEQKNWKPNKVLQEQAIQFYESEFQKLRSHRDKSPEEIRSLAEKKVARLIEEGRDTFNKSKRNGSLDVSQLKRRQDLPKEIRALYGEYSDPYSAYMVTMSRLAHLVESNRFLRALKEVGYGTIFFDPNDPNAPAETTVKVAADGSKSYFPLAGLYTYPEIADFLQQWDKANYPGWLMAISSFVNWSLTVASPVTQIRNVVGNLPIMVSNGYILKNPIDTVNFVKSTAKAIRGKGDKEIERIHRLMTEAGLTGDSMVVAALKDHLKRIDTIPTETGLWKKGSETVADYYNRVVTDGVLSKAYQGSDSFFKVFSYYNERERYAKAMFKTEYDSLTDEQRDEVDNRAIEIVKNTVPNYSRIGELFKILQRSPVIGMFISFQVESMRTSFNQWALALNEITNPDTRSIGFERLTGIMAVSMLRAGLVATLGHASGVGLSGIASYFADDEDEKERQQAIRKAMPPWADLNDLIVTYNETKKSYEVYDVSAIDPYNTNQRLMNSWIHATSFADGLKNTGEEIGDKFLSLSLIMETFAQVNSGENAYGMPIASPSEDSFTQKVQYADHIARNFIASYRTIMKAVDKKEFEARQVLGLNSYEINPLTAFERKYRDFAAPQEAEDDAIYRLNRLAKKSDSFDEFSQRAKAVIKDDNRNLKKLLDFYKSMELLDREGNFKQRTLDMLKEKRASKRMRQFILREEVPPIDLKKIWEKAKSK